jgi:hypothetical protein
MPTPLRLSREVYVPQVENGALHYIIMEIIATSDADSGWTVKDLPNQHFPTATGPSAVSTAAIDGPDNQKNSKSGLGRKDLGQAGLLRGSNFE